MPIGARRDGTPRLDAGCASGARVDGRLDPIQSGRIERPTRRSLDDVVADLNRTHLELDATAVVSERIRLRDRLNELRAEAAALRGGAVAHLTDEQLASEIRSAQRQLEVIRTGRFDTSMVGGATGLGGGLDPMQVARHNQRVDAEGGRADLERRLGELRREADRRR